MCTLYSTICCIQPACSILYENNDVVFTVSNFHFKFNMNLIYDIWDCIFLIFSVSEGKGRFLFFLFKTVGKGGNYKA